MASVDVQQLMRYVDEASGPIESVIMGDYNTYYDFVGDDPFHSH